jgi:hypothetical protein
MFNACHITGAELLRICVAHSLEVRKPPAALMKAECSSVLGAREIRIGELSKIGELRERVAKPYAEEDVKGVRRLKDSRGLSLYANLLAAGKILSPAPARDLPADDSPEWTNKLSEIARVAPWISMPVIRHWMRFLNSKQIYECNYLLVLY